MSYHLQSVQLEIQVETLSNSLFQILRSSKYLNNWSLCGFQITTELLQKFSIGILGFCNSVCFSLAGKMSILGILTFYKNHNFWLSGWAVLNFWRFQPQIVLKLFLFPDIFKQLI